MARRRTVQRKVPESLSGLDRGDGPAPVQGLHAFDLLVVEGQPVAQLIEPLQVSSHAAELQHLTLGNGRRDSGILTWSSVESTVTPQSASKSTLMAYLQLFHAVLDGGDLRGAVRVRLLQNGLSFCDPALQGVQLLAEAFVVLYSRLVCTDTSQSIPKNSL